MLNAERILATLDRYLDHELSLVLYGRAAIALGFAHPPVETQHSLDVDAIVRRSQTEAIDRDLQFWEAKEATNAELSKAGLYITHLFMEEQVFLRRDWERQIVPITQLPLRWLRLFRPATLDLLLTKMMRGEDAADLRDVAFLIERDRISRAQLEQAFAAAVIPDLEEMRDAFERAKPRVLALAKS